MAKNYQLYATEDYVKDGKTVVRKGDILCSDTIRSWYPTPLYQLYILDAVAEANLNANQFQGAQGKGCNGDMYLFRLADTYLPVLRLVSIRATPQGQPKT